MTTSSDKINCACVETTSTDKLFFPFDASSRDLHVTSGFCDNATPMSGMVVTSSSTAAHTSSSASSSGGGKYKQYACPNCKYVTDRKNNLKRHLLTMHEKCSKLLECCDAIFPNKSALRQHVTERHAGAGYGCGVCGRRFSRKALMKRHAAVHSGQREHSCALCDYATSHKSNLDRHVRRHQQQQQQRPLTITCAEEEDEEEEEEEEDGELVFVVGSPSSATVNGRTQERSRIRNAGFRPLSISSSSSSSASSSWHPSAQILRRHGYALNTTGVSSFHPYMPPLFDNNPLLRQRAILKFLSLPALTAAAAGWTNFVASSRHHGYADNWDDMVALVTDGHSKDRGISNPIINPLSRSRDAWPLNLKFSKDDPQPTTTADNDPQRHHHHQRKLGLDACADEPRDLSVTSGWRNDHAERLPVAVDVGRRTRLVPNLHTCAECSLTFASQLELRNHAETSHPVGQTGSHLKSITLQVREAQRVAEQTSGLV